MCLGEGSKAFTLDPYTEDGRSGLVLWATAASVSEANEVARLGRVLPTPEDDLSDQPVNSHVSSLARSPDFAPSTGSPNHLLMTMSL